MAAVVAAGGVMGAMVKIGVKRGLGSIAPGERMGSAFMRNVVEGCW